MSARVGERIATVMVAVGGLGTIIAVCLVFVFLLWEALPLLFAATAQPARQAEFQAPPAIGGPLAVDESQRLAWQIDQLGTLRLLSLADGSVLNERALFENRQPTVTKLIDDGQTVVCGFADGAVEEARITFRSNKLDQAARERYAKLEIGKSQPGEGGLVTRTDEESLRLDDIDVQPSGTIAQLADGEPVRLIDATRSGDKSLYCAMGARGTLAIARLDAAAKPADDQAAAKTEFVATDYRATSEPNPPAFLLISKRSDSVFLASPSGQLARIDIRKPPLAPVLERVDLVEAADAELTALRFLLGRRTLVAGDSQGGLSGWFLVAADNKNGASQGSADNQHSPLETLVKGHEFDDATSAVTALATGPRSRIVAAGHADGSVRLFYAPTERLLLTLSDGASAEVQALALAPREKGLVALVAPGPAKGDTGGGSENKAPVSLAQWQFDLAYPEVSVGALLAPSWYEGYSRPRHVWQTTGGASDYETKLGLVPLIFGTLKATIYALAFAVPVALLAAIYTSEFLHPTWRARIKPVLEMMASLPSVVLGFLAGVVVAPLVGGSLSSVLAAMAMIPLVLVCGAYVWQLLPQKVLVRLTPWRAWYVALLFPVGLLAAVAVGPLVERWLFAGDLEAWLDGQVGSAIGGWWALLLPPAAIFTAWLLWRFGNPWLRHRAVGWSRLRCGIADIVKFAVAVTFAVGLALLAGWMLHALRLDPRGPLIGTYASRNALVVGLIMSFALIPIIYTIADDALASVPRHLRAASLGAGATPWQTAVRVIVPTAASGLFSAVMIGLGRAVGETMIVLMAAGNTPIIDWNIFSGFQTLSAAIATELQESVQGSSHYRTLFVAALALFGITFAVNTAAELVRIRFRRRAYEL